MSDEAGHGDMAGSNLQTSSANRFLSKRQTPTG